jgi:hypothetical protein
LSCTACGAAHNPRIARQGQLPAATVVLGRLSTPYLAGVAEHPVEPVSGRNHVPVGVAVTLFVAETGEPSPVRACLLLSRGLRHFRR